MASSSYDLTRARLPQLLRKHAGAKSTELAALAKVSTPTMVRMLNAMGSDVLRLGKARATRYFLRRTLNGKNASIHVYGIDEEGIPIQVQDLHLIAPHGTVMDVASMGWPMDAEFASGIWPDGLPYPLQDMHPQGFLGRQFARREGVPLGVSSNPKEWSDDDILTILLAKGTDTSGNLLLGDHALQTWLEHKATPQKMFTPDTILAGYCNYAEQASAMGVAGSSAGGEFPKFTALRGLDGSKTPHVIVKFSADDRSATVQRWSDLLVCEHLALQAVRGIPTLQSANSRILQHSGRTFLELERFDRHGLFGRSPLCSLAALEASIMPATSTDWGDAGDKMHAVGWLTQETAYILRTLWAFGKLIANTDMHKGNVSFSPLLPMQVSPVYDMLPMAYAPLAGGEIPVTTYAPSLPLPKDREAWLVASKAALYFWQMAGEDERVSLPFRVICKANGEELTRLASLA